MTVSFGQRDEFATMVLERPDALNALSPEMLRDISAHLDSLAASKGPRALFITGAGGKAFCAGADVNGLGKRTVTGQKRGVELAQQTFRKLDNLPIPSIALVDGYALGGGLELALACSFRIASTRARFSLPEIKLGLVPSYGGTQRLPRIVGETNALDMVMTGRMVDADEARQMGLVSQVVEPDQMWEAGITFARRFTCHSLPALAFSRRAVQRALDVSLDDGMMIEAGYSSLAHQTQDSKEGVAAFREKRTANFIDE